MVETLESNRKCSIHCETSKTGLNPTAIIGAPEIRTGDNDAIITCLTSQREGAGGNSDAIVTS
jgi:hypothetical protein